MRVCGTDRIYLCLDVYGVLYRLHTTQTVLSRLSVKALKRNLETTLTVLIVTAYVQFLQSYLNTRTPAKYQSLSTGKVTSRVPVCPGSTVCTVSRVSPKICPRFSNYLKV